MPAFRVFLECSAPTRAATGFYDTFVAVSDDEYSAGEHLRVACRRAGILGYGGPYVVREVRRLGPVAIAAQETFATPVETPDGPAQRRSARLARLVADAEREATVGPPPECPLQHDRPATPRQAPVRRGRAATR